MKKTIALLMAAMLLFPSCGQTTAPPQGGGSSDVQSSQSEQPDLPSDAVSSDSGTSTEKTDSDTRNSEEAENSYMLPDEVQTPVYPEMDSEYLTEGLDKLPSTDNLEEMWGYVSDEFKYYFKMYSDRLQYPCFFPPFVQKLYDALPEEVSIQYKNNLYSWYDVDESFDVPLSAFHYEKNPDGKSCKITKIDGMEKAKILVVPFSIDGLTVTELGERVCADSSLEVVEMFSVAKIGKGAFANCRNLYRVHHSFTLTIDDYAFFQCTSLQDFNFWDVVSIGEGAFKHCAALPKVELGENLIHLGQSAFSGCLSLSYVRLLGGEVKSGEGCTVPSLTFVNCASLQTVIIGGKVTVVEDYSFTGRWEKFYVSFIFGEGVQEIGFLDINQDLADEAGKIISVRLPSTLKNLRTGTLTELFYAGSAEDFQKIKLDKPIEDGVHVYYEYVNPYNFNGFDVVL